MESKNEFPRKIHVSPPVRVSLMNGSARPNLPVRLVKRAVVIGLFSVGCLGLWEWATFPDIAALAAENPKTTAFMERRRSELRKEGKSDQIEWQWVRLDRISPNIRRAVIVSEDSAFYDHTGLDIEQLKKSLEENLEKGGIARGGSTITQQLAKNLYLSPSKNPYRKLRELLITKSLERQLTKKRILEIYLNVVEFGERTYGVEAASRRYFSRSAATVSEEQAALLAGSLPNPRRMNPGAPDKRLLARQKIILSRMKTWGRWLQ